MPSVHYGEVEIATENNDPKGRENWMEGNILIMKKMLIKRKILSVMCFSLGLTIGVLIVIIITEIRRSSHPSGQSSNDCESCIAFSNSLTSMTETDEMTNKSQSTNHSVTETPYSKGFITTTTTTPAIATKATASVDEEMREAFGTNDTIQSLDIKKRECVPMDVYIQWSEIRKYLVRFKKMAIPDVGEGRPLKVRRCLYFMSTCNFGEAICFTSNQTYTEGNVILTEGGKEFGQYKLVFVEDTECKCTNNTARKDQMDEPWYPPVIVQAKFIKFNISKTS